MHNNRILSNEKRDQPKHNCQQKDTCPLEGHCLYMDIVSLAENTFKDRFYKQCNSSKYEGKANSTELSKHFWEIKRKGIKKPIMHWSVIDHTKPYQNGSKRRNLCLTEKFHILTSPVNLINKSSELVWKCRHENKFQLVNYKAIPPAN